MELPQMVEVPPAGETLPDGAMLAKVYDSTEAEAAGLKPPLSCAALYAASVNGKVLAVALHDVKEWSDDERHKYERYEAYLASREEVRKAGIDPGAELMCPEGERTTSMVSGFIGPRQAERVVSTMAWQELCCMDVLAREKTHELTVAKDRGGIVR